MRLSTFAPQLQGAVTSFVLPEIVKTLSNGANTVTLSGEYDIVGILIFDATGNILPSFEIQKVITPSTGKCGSVIITLVTDTNLIDCSVNIYVRP